MVSIWRKKQYLNIKFEEKNIYRIRIEYLNIKFLIECLNIKFRIVYITITTLSCNNVPDQDGREKNRKTKDWYRLIKKNENYDECYWKIHSGRKSPRKVLSTVLLRGHPNASRKKLSLDIRDRALFPPRSRNL